ncbi:DUF1302 domain-containing protein [Spongorhabdus nitratireducens]
MKKSRSIRLSQLALAVGLGISAMNSQAIQFDLMDGEVTGSLDTTVSAGISVSTEDPRKDLMAPNGGMGGNGPSVTADDMRQNFKKGDVISNQYKVFSELSLDYENYSVRISGKAWYDHWLETKNGRFKDFDDSGWAKLAKFKGVELLDAYVAGAYDIGEMPLDVRVGKQVVSWGESTFILGGINAINPLDAAAFNRPGVEIKEGLLPVEMVYASLGLTDTVTLEAFYQLKWRATVLDGCGTFFAPTDIIQPGCGPVYLSSSLPESTQKQLNLYGPHLSDNSPKDSGQWGASIKYYADWLNATEFGAYFINYHNRTPNASGFYGKELPGMFGGPAAPSPGYSTPDNAAKYFADYVENIRLYGLSFNTSLESGWSLSGEVSHRPNAPIQLNANNLLVRGISLGGNPANAGQPLIGYHRKPVTQVQFTLMNTYPQVLGAGSLNVIGEVGYTHISSLGDELYGRSTAFGSNNGTANCQSDPNLTDKYCEKDGYITSDSWGYRLRASLNYGNLIPGADVVPSLAFRHDVDGYSSNFSEDQKAVTLGLASTWYNAYKVSLSYTNFFDGGKYSLKDDRDNVAFSVSATF